MTRKKTKKKPPFWQRAWFIILTTIFVMGSLAVGSVMIWPQEILGTAVRYVTAGPAPNSKEIINGELPGISTLRDKDGNVITHFYNQRRTSVPSDQINSTVKDALVAIEDRRFYEHEGVDWYGVMRAAVSNATNESTQGASTLTQQYVKNYTWLVTAQTDEERDAAIQQTTSRKLTEITTAEDVNDALSKDEIITRYLNLVTFGHGSYGIQDAARTYFNSTAKDLTLSQAAMLVGMVQSPSSLDPYANEQEVKARRDLVIDQMLDQGYIDSGAAQSAKAQPLGVVKTPNILPNGCADTGADGFFCDRVVKDLEAQGITIDMLKSDNYDITTSLDRKAQDSVNKSLKANANPKEPGVAEAMTLIEPGNENHFIRAMGTSRDYGFDGSQMQTTLPLADSNVGNGAGSVFKVFTAALAVSSGMGNNSPLNVPADYQASGLGDGGNEGCPPGKYCITNAGTYPGSMTFTDILAQSPNTPFVMLAEQMGNPNIVDLAIKMGLRSYNDKGEDGVSLADTMRNSGSFTLGPTPVSTVEMSNVAATIASNGVWCEPSTLVSLKHGGEDKALSRNQCEQVLKDKDAKQLAHALSQDTVKGTASTTAKNTGWGDRPTSAKTGTTDSNQSASFLGFTGGLAGFVYAFNDGNNSPLCTSPLRQCAEGNIFGGNEPAKTWMEAMAPIVDSYGGARLPDASPDDLNKPSSSFETASSVAVGKTENEAKAALQSKGYTVTRVNQVDNKDVPRGTVTGVFIINTKINGGDVSIDVSNTGIESKEENKPDRSTSRGTRDTTPPTTRRRPSRSLQSPRTPSRYYGEELHSWPVNEPAP